LVRRRAAEVALFLKDAPAPVQSQLAQQSVDELAQQVIAGKLGSGDARRQALGARYDEVQAKVNQILGGSKPAAPAQPAPTTTYTIRSGDSLSAIAAKFGTTVQNLVNLNGIADPNKIYAGQVLKISGSAPAASVAPKAQPVYHKIVSGDSVSKIAAKYGTTVQNIVNLNGLKDANKIYAGQTLRVK
jgi:LysM repeat protein